jgi:hypothetical protein
LQTQDLRAIKSNIRGVWGDFGGTRRAYLNLVTSTITGLPTLDWISVYFG